MPDATRKDGVHPKRCSAAESGKEAAIAPSCPSWPVSWVSRGVWRTRNHRATMRITLTKTMASPPPMRIRAASPTPNVAAKANQNWPAVIRSRPPKSIRREPTRSRSTPTGTCIAA